MFPIILVIVWVASCLLCDYILRKRKVNASVFIRFLGVLFGPLAIPFAFFYGPPGPSSSEA